MTRRDKAADAREAIKAKRGDPMGISAESLYRGHAQWFRLVSNNLCFGPCPGAQDEVEQHLRIGADGRVWLSRYAYGAGDRYVCTSEEQIEIGAEAAERIMDAVDDCFADRSPQRVTDVGTWDLTVANQDGEEFRLDGSLFYRPECPEAELSDLIRSTLRLPDLFALDGNRALDRVERLRIDYHRGKRIKPVAGETAEDVAWDYTERLMLDRATGTLEHVLNIGGGVVSRKYQVRGAVEDLLDDIEEDFFDGIAGEPEDATADPLDQNDFRLTVDYRRAPQRVMTGFYGKDALPPGWPDLMEEIDSFMCCCDMGEILDPSVYAKSKRRSNERIFLHAAFDDYGKTYCYLTEDDSIAVGDHVLVPVGSQGRTAVVRVKGIEHLPEDRAPIPFEKIKSVIRKYTAEDPDEEG